MFVYAIWVYGFWFLTVLLRFLRLFLDISCDFRIHVMIWDSFIKLMAWVFIYQNVGYSVCFILWIHLMIQSKLDIFCDLCKNGFVEWFKQFLKQSRAYLRFACENFKICVMSMRICCYDLVGVDSKTLEPFIFIYFVYVFFC
jgi:hypothetical protein